MDHDGRLVPIEVLSVPDTLPQLSRGSHLAGSPTPCAMEAASWLAGEPWSAQPRSVHPVISMVARTVNDAIDDKERQLLWPLIMASLGTRRSGHLILHLRLDSFARRMLRGGTGPSISAWEAVLKRFEELTRNSTTMVPRSRISDLEARLRRSAPWATADD